ncbi:hypothetical protein RYH75_11390 [Stenotrophomonas geniculata]|uniref:hypothetical protein n=1 Tax=Stenotrophomonas geniculata TaxID=86188 RepID=UPI00294A1E4E|nr:hypothetical protein [Stenotrophomonas geniculata]MDV6189857.1 hypothetical protein [Stenotrophomonas geniculata]
MNNSITSACSPAEEFEAEGLRDRLRVTESQIAQLEYAIAQLSSRLSPVLRPELVDPKSDACSNTPQPTRSPLAQEAHSQGLRIYQAHRDLYSIEQRLAL